MNLWEKCHGETIQIKVTEQCFPAVLFNMLYKVFLTFESLDENYPKVWPSKWKLLSITFLWYCLFNAVQGGSNFWICERNAMVNHTTKTSWQHSLKVFLLISILQNKLGFNFKFYFGEQWACTRECKRNPSPHLWSIWLFLEFQYSRVSPRLESNTVHLSS